MARAEASLITLVAAAIALAGCGADSGLSKTALDSKANAICADETTARDAIALPSNIGDVTQAAAYFDQIVPILSGATSKLAELKPADSVTSSWEAFMSLRKQLTTTMQAIRHKADISDASGLADLKAEPALGTRVDNAATRIGATRCAESGAGPFPE